MKRMIVFLMALAVLLSACISISSPTACYEDGVCSVDEKFRGGCEDCKADFSLEEDDIYLYYNANDESLELSACVKNTGGEFYGEVPVQLNLNTNRQDEYDSFDTWLNFNEDEVEAGASVDVREGEIIVENYFRLSVGDTEQYSCFWYQFEDVEEAASYSVNVFINNKQDVEERDYDNNVGYKSLEGTPQFYPNFLIQEDIGDYDFTHSYGYIRDYYESYTAYYDLENSYTYVAIRKKDYDDSAEEYIRDHVYWDVFDGTGDRDSVDVSSYLVPMGDDLVYYYARDGTDDIEAKEMAVWESNGYIVRVISYGYYGETSVNGSKIIDAYLAKHSSALVSDNSGFVSTGDFFDLDLGDIVTFSEVDQDASSITASILDYETKGVSRVTLTQNESFVHEGVVFYIKDIFDVDVPEEKVTFLLVISEDVSTALNVVTPTAISNEIDDDGFFYLGVPETVTIGTTNFTYYMFGADFEDEEFYYFVYNSSAPLIGSQRGNWDEGKYGYLTRSLSHIFYNVSNAFFLNIPSKGVYAEIEFSDSTLATTSYPDILIGDNIGSFLYQRDDAYNSVRDDSNFTNHNAFYNNGSKESFVAVASDFQTGSADILVEQYNAIFENINEFSTVFDSAKGVYRLDQVSQEFFLWKSGDYVVLVETTVGEEIAKQYLAKHPSDYVGLKKPIVVIEAYANYNVTDVNNKYSVHSTFNVTDELALYAIKNISTKVLGYEGLGADVPLEREVLFSAIDRYDDQEFAQRYYDDQSVCIDIAYEDGEIVTSCTSVDTSRVEARHECSASNNMDCGLVYAINGTDTTSNLEITLVNLYGSMVIEGTSFAFSPRVAEKYCGGISVWSGDQYSSSRLDYPSGISRPRIRHVPRNYQRDVTVESGDAVRFAIDCPTNLGFSESPQSVNLTFDYTNVGASLSQTATVEVLINP